MTEKSTSHGCLWWAGLIGLSMAFAILVLMILAALFLSSETSTNTFSRFAPTALQPDAVSGAGQPASSFTDSATVEATYETICKTDPSWTEIQTGQYLAGFAGRQISGWNGWVYEVRESFGQYELLIAMEPPGGMFWSRDVQITGIPADMAIAMQKEQPIQFSGTIERVDRLVGTNCNPIVVKDATFAGREATGGAGNTASALVDPATVEATYETICKTDPSWTEIQTGQYLAGFAGRQISGWNGWVYEVRESFGQYELLIAMEPPGGMFWSRDVQITGIPADMAIAMQKEQPIQFSGTIERVDRLVGTNCNPIVVKDATFAGREATGGAGSIPTPPPAPLPSTVNTTANLHAQPDPGSAVIAVAHPGQPLVVAGQDASGQWLQLASGYWIAAAVVDNVPAGLPVTAQPTPTPAPAGPVANTTATVHGSPSPDSDVVITAQPGQPLVVTGQDVSGQWLQLASGYWIAAAAVDNVPAGLPVTAVVVEAAEPTATPSWQREERGIIFTSECPCDQGDALNCSDFGIALDGQACYLRCMDLASRDVHDLDRDKDGSACEWTW